MPLTVRLNMGKMLSSRQRLHFFQIAIILSEIEGRHTISVKFDFGLNRAVHSGVTGP